MFMRYRGGGVGHLYMRAIEVWLTETGWGSNDTLGPTNEDIDSGDALDDSEDNPGNGSGGSEDEVSEGTTGSDEDHGSGTDPDTEHSSSENEEETMDGEYGFSSL